MKKLIVLLLLFLAPAGAQKHPLEILIEAARTNSPALKELLPANIHDLKERGGSAVWGQDFLFAIDIETVPSISIDRKAPVKMNRVPGSNSWYLLVKLRTGFTHSYEFFSDGKPMSLMYSYDVAGYNMDSYPKPGVPQGTMSPKRTIISKIYDGLATDYWIYASPGVDPSRPSAVMVWQDGESIVGPKDLVRLRLAIVTENLVSRNAIPPLIHVLISPGKGMRGQQYGTISDRYGRYLLEEVLPEVGKTYRLRTDGYSHAIAGLSAGGICSFTAAWHFPSEFSRVFTHVGSFAGLSGKPGSSDGGYLYPVKVRQEPRKNLRIWISSGTYDYERAGGSFPLGNILLANALKFKEYDFHFRFGEAMHSVGQPALDLPEALAWLWRDYDPAKTAQTYEIEAEERAKPPFRVKIVNRDSW
jgi:enterochelin esterase family protein